MFALFCNWTWQPKTKWLLRSNKQEEAQKKTIEIICQQLQQQMLTFMINREKTKKKEKMPATANHKRKEKQQNI